MKIKKILSRANDISLSMPITAISLVLASIGTVSLYLAIDIPDRDFWWHMRYGATYLENMSWNLDHSMFSWIDVDSEWHYSTWLSSISFYLIYKVSGITGLLALRWLITASLFALLFLYTAINKQKISVVHVLFVFLAASVVGFKIVVIRPDLYSLLFFTLLLIIYFQAKQGHVRLLYALPPLFLLWVNVHGGFFIGGIFLIAMIIIEFSISMLKHTPFPVHLKHASFAAILSLLLTTINPHGIHYLTTTIKALIFTNDSSLGFVQEFTSIFSTMFSIYNLTFFQAGWLSTFLMASLLVLQGYMFFTGKRPELSITIINSLFYYNGMATARALMFYPILWYVSFIYETSKNCEKSLRKTALLSLVLLIALFLWCLLFNLKLNTDKPLNFHSKIDYPEKETNYIIDNKLPGPIFNDYTIGGYLLWHMYPHYKVMVDPRYGPYRQTEFWQDYMNFHFLFKTSSFTILEQRYKFKSAIVSYLATGVINIFLEHPNWFLLFFDKQAAVFVHTSEIPNIYRQTEFEIDLTGNYFADIHNPTRLTSIFTIYTTIHLGTAKKIRDLYDKNVRDTFISKKHDLRWMDNYLIRKGIDPHSIE